MNKKLIAFFLVVSYLFSTECVVINEIHYNPDSSQGQSDEDYEFIELYNQCNEQIDISQWSLYRHDSCWGCYYDKMHQFGHNVHMGPNEYILLSRNGNTYNNSIDWFESL